MPQPFPLSHKVKVPQSHAEQKLPYYVINDNIVVSRVLIVTNYKYEDIPGHARGPTYFTSGTYVDIKEM